MCLPALKRCVKVEAKLKECGHLQYDSFKIPSQKFVKTLFGRVSRDSIFMKRPVKLIGLSGCLPLKC